MCGPPALAAVLGERGDPIAVAAIAGFLVGSVPFGYLLGRALGHDLRKLGSGNIGATNLARNAGLRWGIVAFILDAAKGAGPVLAARHWGGDGISPVVAGGAAVLGHCFTPFLGFRGGKGVATMAGALGVLAPVVAGGLVLLWGFCLAALRNVGMASSLTSLGALGAGIWLLIGNGEHGAPAVGVLLVALSGLVLVRHRSNIGQYFRESREAER